MSIRTTPLNLLLAQKFTALLQRKRSKGRDFFDIVFLLSKSIKPDYDYLSMKMDISSSTQLRERVRALCAKTDIEDMVADVRSFLFYPADEKKIRLFLPIVEQADLG